MGKRGAWDFRSEGLFKAENSILSNTEKIKLLRKNISEADERQNQLLFKANEFKGYLASERITYAEYEWLLSHYLRGKSLNEWLFYYENYKLQAKMAIAELEQICDEKTGVKTLEAKVEIPHKKKPFHKHVNSAYLIPFFVVFALVGAFFLGNAITGFVTVEFPLNESWDVGNSFVRVSINEYSEDRALSEFVSENIVSVDLETFSIPSSGTVYVDLIVSGLLAESRRAEYAIENVTEENATEIIEEPTAENITELPIEENITEEPNTTYYEPPENATEAPLENVTEIPIEENITEITEESVNETEIELNITEPVNETTNITLPENITEELNITEPLNITMPENITNATIEFNLTGLNLTHTFDDEAVGGIRTGENVLWMRQIVGGEREAETFYNEAEDITLVKKADLEAKGLRGIWGREHWSKADKEALKEELWKKGKKLKKRDAGNESYAPVEEPEQGVDYFIFYETPAPSADIVPDAADSETPSAPLYEDNKITVIVSAPIEYKNVTVAYPLTDYKARQFTVYWLVNSSRIKMNSIGEDTDGDGIEDNLIWIAPHLSNQTFELEITVINVYESPAVGSNWTVFFNTTGTGNLSIMPFNDRLQGPWEEMKQDVAETQNEMKLLELYCGEERITDNLFVVTNESQKRYGDISDSESIASRKILLPNYTCDGKTSYIVNKIDVPGYISLNFTFANDFGSVSSYAHDPAVGTVYNFTTCGQVANKTGPTQAQCNTAYTGTTLTGNVTVGSTGIQNWTVPATGIYRIEVWGAGGGMRTAEGTIPIGYGTKMAGNFTLTQGTNLSIIVGQNGSSALYHGGGGGGSFVSLSNYTPLIVAGGGGGASMIYSDDSLGDANMNASTGTSGKAGYGHSNYPGSAGGTGGDGGAQAVYGGSGGGFNTDGYNGSAFGKKGYSFKNGGTGGEAYSFQYGEGGFGGGASGYSGSGGGGYSGGGGAGWSEWGNYPEYGGGGGSYNAGTGTSNSTGANRGNGRVDITILEISGGTTPSQSTPTINTTLGTNYDNENITAFNVSSTNTLTNIWDWKKNGAPIALLNMPFDTNYANSSIPNIIRDYSGNNNNGTGGSGTASKTPRWTSGGKSGGAYYFDGIDDYINTSYINLYNKSFSLEAWVLPNITDANAKAIFDKGGFWASNNGYVITQYGAGNRLLIYVNNIYSLDLNGFFTTGSWVHTVITFNSSNWNMTAYKDGAPAGSAIIAPWNINNANPTFIGIGTSGNTLPDDYPFNGTIDGARIWNTTLTAAQVATHYNGGVPRYDRIEQSMTSVGDIWQACVTPNDGTQDGATLCTANLTILGSPPTHSAPTINTTYGTNLTTENITAFNVSTSDPEGDAVKNIWSWYKDGVSLMALNMPFEGGSNSTWTQDYSGEGNNGTVEGGASYNIEAGYDGKGAYIFDGIDDYIEVADDSSLDLTTAITLEAWIKSNGSAGYIVAKDPSPTANITYKLTMDTTAANCQPNTAWTWGSCGATSGWGNPSGYVDGSRESYVMCNWTDTLSPGTTITAITIDPHYTAHYEADSYADWVLNDIVFYNNDNLGGIGANCVTYFDYPAPYAIVGTEDMTHYNISANNKLYIYKQLGSWYILEGTNAYINITVTYNLPKEEVPYALSAINGGQFLIKNSTRSYNMTAGGSITDNKWHHIVATYDSTNMSIYVDGLLKNTSSNEYRDAMPTNDDPLWIGRHWNPDETAQWFNGTIDEVRIWKRALSAQQIAALYANQTNRIVQQETEGGETWQACVTPNDGNVNGETLCTAELRVLSGYEMTNPGTITPVPYGEFGNKRNNTFPGGYSWGEIALAPLKVAMSDNDTGYNSTSIGFNFNFFGNTYSKVNITADGVLTFGPAAGVTSPGANSNLPTAKYNDSIFGFWDDLDLGNNGAGSIYSYTTGTAPNRLFAVEYYNVSFKGDYKGGITFEVILFEAHNNSMVVYKDMGYGNSKSYGASATVGIQNKSSTLAINYSVGMPALTNKSVVSFYGPTVNYNANRQPFNMSYEWEEINTTGTALYFPNKARGGNYTPLGFNFSFYGNTYTSINVTTEGYMTFDLTSAISETNYFIPSTDGPESVIAPWWDDFNSSGSNNQGNVYVKTAGVAPYRRFIAEWHEVANGSGGFGNITFQAILYETTNNIRFNYYDAYYKASVEDGNYGETATIGIEDDTGANGQLISYDTERIYQNTVSFLLTTETVCESPVDNKVITKDTLLCPGTYEVADAAEDGLIQTNSNNTLIQCADTIMQGKDTGYGLIISGEHNINFTGCTINEYSQGARITSGKNNTLKQNNFHNNTAYGVYAGQGSNSMRITYNNFTLADESSQAVYATNSNLSYIAYNDIRGTASSTGITTIGNNETIYRNTIYLVGESSNGIIDWGLIFVRFGNISFNNITANGGTGIMFYNETDVYGNIINSSGSGYPLAIVGTGNRIWINNIESTGEIQGTTAGNDFCVNYNGVDEGNFYAAGSPLIPSDDCGAVNITYPFGGDAFNETYINITWKNQSHSPLKPLWYTVSFSNDSKVTWQNLSTYWESSMFRWNITNSSANNIIDSVNYWINVTPFVSTAHANATYTHTNFTIDHTPPHTIALNSYPNGSAYKQITMDEKMILSWTATDNLGVALHCDVAITNVPNAAGDKNVACTSGSLCTATITNASTEFSEGAYYWNVTCNDTAGNINRSNNWVFYIDRTNATITSPNVTATDPSLRIINATSSVDVGTNITFSAILADSLSGITNAWVRIWKTTKEAGILLWEGLMSLVNGVWQVSWVTNASLTTGLANYTIYVNDTAGNIFEYDSNFSVNYKPTQGTPVIYSGHFNTTFGNLTCYNTSTADADGDAVVNVFDWRRNVTGNLLADGNMEAADTSAWSAGQSATLSKETSSPHGGSRVLRVAYNSAIYPYAYQINMVSGKTYHITGWARGDGTIAPGVYWGLSGMVWTGTSSTSWQYFDVISTANNNNLDLVALITSGSGYVEFDDVKAEEIGSDALINMPLEANRDSTQAKNYALRGTNGTITGGLIYNNTGGHDGRGAYQWDGTSGDYIGIANFPNLSANDGFTIGLWYKRARNGVNILYGHRVHPKGILAYLSDNTAAIYYNDGTTTFNLGPTGFSDIGNWHYMAVVYDIGGNMTLYMDGKFNSTISIAAAGSYYSTSSFYIGADISDTTNTWNGTLDHFNIWNRTLYPVEIASLYNAGSPQYNMIEKSALKYGDSWVCAVTPNDGNTDGNVSSSIGTTINTPPSQGAPTINTTLGMNRSNENITAFNMSTADVDFDSVTNAWTWYRNGSSFEILNMPFDINYTNHTAIKAIKDYSGYGYNGTGGGGIATKTPRWEANCGGFNNSGGCYYFDGGDIIQTELTEPLKNFTLEVWFKDDGSIISYERIADKSYTTGFWLGREGSTASSWGGGVMNASPPFGTYVTLTDDQWHQIVMVRNGTTLTIYGDGGSVSSTTTCPSTALNTEKMAIGAWYSDVAGASGQQFSGRITQAAVWNTSLSPAQIAARYDNGRGSFGIIDSSITKRGEYWSACVTPIDGWYDGNTLCTQNITILNSPPTHDTPTINTTLGTNFATEDVTAFNVNTADPDDDAITNVWNWYKDGRGLLLLNLPLDTNVTSTASKAIKDYSGFGNNGTLGNNTADKVPVWNISGISGGAYEFDGGDLINISDASSLDSAGNITIEAWIYPDSVSGTRAVAVKGAYGSHWNYGLLTRIVGTNTSGTLHARFHNGDLPAPVATVASGKWSHIALVYTGSSGTVYYYHNGTLIGTLAHEWTMQQGAHQLAIGAAYSATASYSEYFDGKIDEVRIWNATLTAEQIEAIYNSGSPQYNVIDSTMTSVGETWSACVTPNDAYLDGDTKCTSSNVTITLPTTYVNLTSPLDSWYVNSTVKFECLASSSGSLVNVSLWHNNTGTWARNATLTATASPAIAHFNVTGLAVNNFIWTCQVCDETHLCYFATINRTLFVDNTKPAIEFHSSSVENNTKRATYYNNAYVNTTISDASNNMSAFIDWNRSLVGYWRLEDTNGTWFKDDSTWGNNGTCSGTACPNLTTGMRGKAYRFDGSNDYITIADSQSLNFTGNFSISAWFKTNKSGTMGIFGEGYSTNVLTIISGGRVILYLNTNDCYVYSTSLISYSDNNWHHVVAMYDTSNNGTMYVDTKPRSDTKVNNNCTNLHSTSTASSIGGFNGGNFFNGSIDEVMVFNRILSPEEINASYSAGVWKLYRNFTGLSSGTYT
ncbi:MAG: LamG domain-containing protein [Candidatus Nanoarchaeia archaeon]|nr:LamG domain-containing protein [Candidatus Nanoarchaeia archaeon]